MEWNVWRESGRNGKGQGELGTWSDMEEKDVSGKGDWEDDGMNGRGRRYEGRKGE